MIFEPTWVPAALCVLVAAVIRGLTGFGFAAVAVVGLALLFPLAEAVPMVLLLEVATSLLLLPGTWAQAERPLLRRLLIAAALGVPLGVWMLHWVDGHWLTLGVYLLVGVLAVLGLARIALPLGHGPLSLWLVGASSGALISAFSTGGPLLVAWLSHHKLSPATLRATLIQFFFAVDLAAIAGLGLSSAIPADTALHALYLLPPLGAGLWLGQRLFQRIPAPRAARFTQWLLLALAGIGLLGWWQA